MPLVVSDREVAFGPDNLPVPVTGRPLVVTAQPTQAALFVQTTEGREQDQAAPRKAPVDGTDGTWTLTLPWPSETRNGDVPWQIRRMDGTIVQGVVPEGVAGPVTVDYLTHQLPTEAQWLVVRPGMAPAQLLGAAPSSALAVPLTQKGVALGVASLNVDGHVPTSQLVIAGPQQQGIARSIVYNIQDTSDNATPGGAYATTVAAFNAQVAKIAADNVAAGTPDAGGTVQLGGGIWFAPQLRVDGVNNIVIKGAGDTKTVIYQQHPETVDAVAGGPAVLFERCTGGRIEDCRIVGYGASSGGINPYLNALGLWVSQCDGFTVRNVVVEDALHCGAYFYRVSDPIIEGLTVLNTHATSQGSYGDGVGIFFFTGTNGMLARGIKVKGADGHGVVFDAGTNPTLGDADVVRDNEILGLNCTDVGRARALYGLAGGGNGAAFVMFKGARKCTVLGVTFNGNGIGPNHGIIFQSNQNGIATEGNMVLGGTMANVGAGIVDYQGAGYNVAANIEVQNIGLWADAPGDVFALYFQGPNQNNIDPFTGVYPVPFPTIGNVARKIRLRQDPNGPFLGSSPCTKHHGPQAACSVSVQSPPLGVTSALDAGPKLYFCSFLPDGRETPISPAPVAEVTVTTGQQATITLPLGDSDQTTAGTPTTGRALYRYEGTHTAWNALTTAQQKAALLFVRLINDNTTTQYVDLLAASTLTRGLRKYTYNYTLSANCVITDYTPAGGPAPTLTAPTGLALVSGSATGGNLANGQYVSVAVTAVDAGGNETQPSNEILVQVPAGGTGHSGSLTVSWAGGGSSAAGFRAYRTDAGIYPRGYSTRVNGGTLIPLASHTGYTWDGTQDAPGGPPWGSIVNNVIEDCDIAPGSSGPYTVYPLSGVAMPPLIGPGANIMGGALSILGNPLAPQPVNISIDGNASMTGRVVAASGVVASSWAPAYSPATLPTASGSPATTDISATYGASIIGTHLYVPCTNANKVDVFDISGATPVLVATITTGIGPVSATAFGAYILVACQGGNQVRIYNASTYALVATINTGASTAPQGICTWAGRYMAVSLGTTGQVAIYDLNVIGSPALLATIAAGSNPFGLTTWTESTTGKTYLAVCNFGYDSVTLLDVSVPASPSLITTVPVAAGHYPFWPSVYQTPGHTLLLVTMHVIGKALTIDVTTPSAATVTGSVAISGTISHQAYIDPASLTAFIPAKDAGTVELVNLNTSPPTKLASLAVAAGPVAVVSGGGTLYVVSQDSTTLQAYTPPPVDTPNLTIGGKAVALADGTNFPALVTTSGAPGDAPEVPAMRYDPATHKLYVWDSAWRSVTLS